VNPAEREFLRFYDERGELICTDRHRELTHPMPIGDVFLLFAAPHRVVKVASPPDSVITFVMVKRCPFPSEPAQTTV
jgi:hypothetical protein